MTKTLILKQLIAAMQALVLAYTQLIGIYTVPTLGGEVPVVAGVENQIVEKLDRFEIVKTTSLLDAGESKVEFIKSRPEVRLQKWNGEVNLGVRYDGVTATAEKVIVLGSLGEQVEKIEYKNAKQELHSYLLPAGEGMEDGGLEIEIVLNEKPATNVFEFQVSGAENLDFFYQPALTAEEIAEGASRPEHVVGSYAVYHKTKANHRVGDTNYATGKAYHIFRPKAIDANGVEEWAELSYTNGVLSVTVPQKFLDDAVYPVKVDPTFGYTSLGATSSNASCSATSDTSTTNGKTGDNTYPLTESGNITQMSVGFVSTLGTETVDVFLALYNEDSAGADSHDLVVSAEALDVSITSTAAFYNINFGSELLSADTYILAALCDGEDIAGVATSINTRTDSGASGLRFYAEGTTGAGGYATRKAENPWTEVDAASTNFTSIYATYTASGGTAPTRRRSSIIFVE